MRFQVFPAAEADLEAIEAIENACFSLPWTREQLRGQLPDGQHEFFTAKDGAGTVLGYAGMMTVLISEMLKAAKRRGLSFVTLEVRGGNQAAIALYAKHGFLPVGKRKNYYELPREDAILMTKFLN